MSGCGIVPGMSRSAPTASLLRSRTVADSANQRHGHLASQFVLDAPANAVLECRSRTLTTPCGAPNLSSRRQTAPKRARWTTKSPRTYVFAHAGAVSTSANRSIAATRRSGLHLAGQRSVVPLNGGDLSLVSASVPCGCGCSDPRLGSRPRRRRGPLSRSRPSVATPGTSRRWGSRRRRACRRRPGSRPGAGRRGRRAGPRARRDRCRRAGRLRRRRRAPGRERAVLDARRDRGASGASVFGDVGQRLGDDEVGGRLDRGGEPADGHVDLDRHRHPRGQRVDSRAQPAAGEDRWEDAVRELAQLGRRALGVVERLGQQGGGILLARSRARGAPA